MLRVHQEHGRLLEQPHEARLTEILAAAQLPHLRRAHVLTNRTLLQHIDRHLPEAVAAHRQIGPVLNHLFL